MKKKIINLVLAILFLLCIFPCFTSVGIGIGSIVPSLWVILIFILINFRTKIKAFSNKLLVLLLIIVNFGVTVFTVMSIIMLTGTFSNAPVNGRTTVIVLGCQVNGSEPSLMLSNRLEAAEEYLKENTDAVCIVTGGRGNNEEMAESAVMKKWLVSHNIDSERIYEENLSESTNENIAFSCKIIDRENLPETAIIVTDEFHQYRARFLAERNGLDAYGKSSSTPWYLFINYWVREMFAIIKDAIFI